MVVPMRMSQRMKKSVEIAAVVKLDIIYCTVCMLNHCDNRLSLIKWYYWSTLMHLTARIDIHHATDELL